MGQCLYWPPPRVKLGMEFTLTAIRTEVFRAGSLIPACTFSTSFDAPIAPGGAYETGGEGRTMAMSLAPCPGSITRQVITELPEPDV